MLCSDNRESKAAFWLGKQVVTEHSVALTGLCCSEQLLYDVTLSGVPVALVWDGCSLQNGYAAIIV